MNYLRTFKVTNLQTIKMSLSEQLHTFDSPDKYKAWNSSQEKKKYAEFLRNSFKIPDKFSNKQILAKEKQLRKTYQKEVNKKEEELGFVMGNIADAMLQQAFYWGDQSSGWSGQSQWNQGNQKHITNVIQAVDAKIARNNREIEEFLAEAKTKAVNEVFW